jgi:hypothetical protein
LLLFYGNKGYAKEPKITTIPTLPVLLKITKYELQEILLCKDSYITLALKRQSKLCWCHFPRPQYFKAIYEFGLGVATDSEGFDGCPDIHQTARTLGIRVRVIDPNMPWSDDLYVALLSSDPHSNLPKHWLVQVTFVIFPLPSQILQIQIFFNLKYKTLL